MLLDCKENNKLTLNSTLVGAIDPEILTLDSFQKSKRNTIEFLSMIFKLNLLLAKHLYVPSGYVFDNPVFQRLLSSDEGFRNILYSQTDDSGTVLYIGIDSATPERLGSEQVFYNWLYGADGRRVNKPCSPLYLGNYELHNALKLSNGDFMGYTLDGYYSDLYPNQYNYSDVIKKVIESSTQVLYPENRHALYKEELYNYFGELSGSDIPDLKKYEGLLDFIRISKKISRSQIKSDYQAIWLKHIDQFIALRQKTYYGGTTGCLSPNYTSSWNLDASSHIDEIVSTIYSESKNHFRIVVERLTFDDIRKVRESEEYLGVTKELDSLIQDSQEIRVEDVKKFLRQEWAPVLFSSVKNVNKSAIIDDNSKRGLAGASLSGIAGVIGTVIGGGPAAIALTVVAAATSMIYATEWNGYRNSLVKFKRGI